MWTFAAIDADTKLVLSWLVGRHSTAASLLDRLLHHNNVVATSGTQSFS